jgi:hypothetical protein
MNIRNVALGLSVLALTACQSNSPVRGDDPYYQHGYGHPVYGPAPGYGGVYSPYPVYRQPAPTSGEVNRQIDKAERQIDKGARKGKLTDAEERRLEGELDRIEDRADRMKADGRFTQRERREVQEDLNQLQRKTQREKRDRERER